MTTSQIRAIVRGTVQGVYFRASTREVALRLGLAGYARNVADGSVEVVAEGPVNELQTLIRYLHTGPPHAQVVAVDWELTEGLEVPRPFRVR